MKPLARRQNIIMQDVGDELIAYDKKRHHVHRLNRSAAKIWHLCDGTRDIDALAALLDDAGSTDLEPRRDIVVMALDQLRHADLLSAPRETKDEQVGSKSESLETLAPSLPRATRRDFMRGAALAGGVLLVPVVTTMVAPTPAMAASGGPDPDPRRLGVDGGGSGGEFLVGIGIGGLIMDKITKRNCEDLTVAEGGDGGRPCYGPGVSTYFCLPDPQRRGKYKCQEVDLGDGNRF